MVRGYSRTIFQYFSKTITSLNYLTYTQVKPRYITMSKSLKIGTHDGCFHCDEALACFMLKTLPQYKDAVIVRSRDKSILDTCDIVIDVGGEYNPSKHRYDHHMSYGIVTDLSSRVQFLNVPWNDKTRTSDEQFPKAVELTGQEFLQHLNYAAHVWLPAKIIVQDAIAKRFEVDPSGEIIELSQPVPWSEHLFELEKEMNVEPLLKYMIFKESNYRIRCVPVKPKSFVARLFLPEAWAGLRNEALETACGVPGAEFVHTIRFTGGHNTREGALMMARKALELGKTI
nr:PREDICTED: UPF0160 protein MYG1, mitochondrial isoform X2 [Megachile rotundata]